jgi:hypothetical protein
MAMHDLQAWTDGRVKCYAFQLLVFGVLPFEQWVSVFANSAFQAWPGLRCKAFAVWFPTMIDYLRNRTKRDSAKDELVRRKFDCLQLFDLADALDCSFEEVLKLYSRDDQIFVRDRRLQNVHGHLHIYSRDDHEVFWFDGQTRVTQKTKISADEYREILKKYYREMQKSELLLLDRLTQSSAYTELYGLYCSRLRIPEYLIPLSREFGIGSQESN